MTPLRSFVSAIKTTFTNVRALAVFAVLYALLLVSSYFFISTREATMWQVVVTYALMILVPAEFFLFQASIINRVRDQKFHWRVIAIDALKFFITTIPVILIAWLLYYLLNKLGSRFPAPVVTSLPIAQTTPKTQPVHWPSLIFATLRFVLLGVATPLALIHLWIAVAGSEIRIWIDEGPGSFLKRIGTALARGFASDSVLVYGLGLILFFALPYVVLFVPFSPKGNKTDFVVFILRLLLAYLFSLIGWIVTVSTLAKRTPDPEPAMAVAIAKPAEAAA